MKIIHENKDVWVGCDNKDYHVFVSGITHSKYDCSFTLDDDGLSLAKARCDYLANSKAYKDFRRSKYIE